MSRITAAQRLRTWIKQSRLKQREVAALLDVDPADLSKYLVGRKLPGLANAVRIEDHTGIPARAWVASPEAESGQTTPSETDNSLMGKR